MNRFLIVLTVVVVGVTSAFSADNAWDGNNSGYDGAFGLADGSSPDWSTATDITTMAPANSDNLGYLTISNPVSTTVTISDSFTGFIDTTLTTADYVTNTFTAADGVVVTGADADNVDPDNRTNPRAAFKVTGVSAGPPISPVLYTSIQMDGGRYEGGRDNTTGAGDLGTLDSLAIHDVSFVGASGGSAYDANAYGSAGLYLRNVNSGLISNGVSSAAYIRGGDGGTIDTSGSLNSFRADGGNGIDNRYGSPAGPVQQLVVTGVDAQGGAGGTISGTANSTTALGGMGIKSENAINVIMDSVVLGGNGGSINAGGDGDLNVSGGDGANFEGRFKPGDYVELYNTTVTGGRGGSVSTAGTGSGIASGGHGVHIRANLESAIVSGGEYQGGAGGSSSETVDAYANGGNGLQFVRTAAGGSLIITNGTFSGGAGGTASGSGTTVEADGGHGVYAQNCVVTVLDGTFEGGTAGTANGAKGDDGEGIVILNSTLNAYGGTFDSIWLDGDGINTVMLTNTTVGGLTLAGTATHNLSFDTTAAITDGAVIQKGGTANVSQWSDHHFQDTRIENGTMNFSGSSFNLDDGNIFGLLSAGSAVNFNAGFTAQSNSQIRTTYDGTSSVIKGTNLEFKQGTKWTIDGGDTDISKDTEIAMASGTGLINDLLLEDVSYVGGSWLGGIVALNKSVTALSGTYGYKTFEDALALDPDSEFGQAMEDLSTFTVITNSPDTDYKALKAVSKDEAYGLLKSEFAGSTEMANTLIRLQGVIADQLSDRSRSYLITGKGKSSTFNAPQGARGPGNADSEALTAWGQGYGSFFNQGETDEFGGYEATIGGAALGVDKRFEKLLVGLGGGYAHSKVNGGWGSNGESDTFYGSAYAALNGERTFLDLNINYGFSDVETDGSMVVGGYVGEYDANTLSMRLGGGVGLPLFSDAVLLTPEASLLSVYYSRDSYTETPTTTEPGDFPDLAWEDYDQWSHLVSLGATFSMISQMENSGLEIEMRPEVRAHWLHDLNAEMDNETYIMDPGGLATPEEAVLQARDENLIRLGAGVRLSKWQSDALQIGLDIDVVLGEDYEAYIGSAKLLHRF